MALLHLYPVIPHRNFLSPAQSCTDALENWETQPKLCRLVLFQSTISRTEEHSLIFNCLWKHLQENPPDQILWLCQQTLLNAQPPIFMDPVPQTPEFSFNETLKPLDAHSLRHDTMHQKVNADLQALRRLHIKYIQSMYPKGSTDQVDTHLLHALSSLHELAWQPSRIIISHCIEKELADNVFSTETQSTSTALQALLKRLAIYPALLELQETVWEETCTLVENTTYPLEDKSKPLQATSLMLSSPYCVLFGRIGKSSLALHPLFEFDPSDPSSKISGLEVAREQIESSPAIHLARLNFQSIWAVGRKVENSQGMQPSSQQDAFTVLDISHSPSVPFEAKRP